MHFIKIIVQYGIYPLTSGAFLVGIGLLGFGVYNSITSETNTDLYTIGGGLVLVGAVLSALILVIFKDKETSAVDYFVESLFWAIG